MRVYNVKSGDEFKLVEGDGTTEAKGNLEVVADAVTTTAGESGGVTADPVATQNGKARENNAGKQELDAIRSGFNDNRNDPTIFGILKEFVELPMDLLKAIMPSNKDTTTDTLNSGKPKGKNLLLNLYNDIADEVKKVTKAYTSMTSSAALKQAKVVLNAKKERLKLMQEKIKEIKDDNILKRLNKNIGSLFSGPSIENAGKNLKSTLDKDVVSKKAGEIAAKQAKKK